jgi:hypothetical protein
VLACSRSTVIAPSTSPCLANRSINR